MGAVSGERSTVTTPVVWVVVWVAVVAVVATSVWLVISRAGAGVSSSETRFAQDRPSAVTSSTSASTRPPRTSRPSRSPSGTPPASATAPTAPGAPVRRTASGSRGTITVECVGATARLSGATPRSGAVSKVEDDGAQRVRVDFEDDEGRTRIEASCAGGQPTFAVDDD
jgi:hypothetical protein